MPEQVSLYEGDLTTAGEVADPMLKRLIELTGSVLDCAAMLQDRRKRPAARA